MGSWGKFEVNWLNWFNRGLSYKYLKICYGLAMDSTMANPIETNEALFDTCLRL